MIKFHRVIMMGSLLMSLTACVFGPYNLSQGINCFKTQDYRSAFIRLLPEAEKGQPDAQYAVGYMYYYGQGVTEDKLKAMYWIGCAAKSGQPDAVLALNILSKEAKAP